MPEIPSGKRYDPKRETDARRELQREIERLEDEPKEREPRGPSLDNEQRYLERQVLS